MLHNYALGEVYVTGDNKDDMKGFLEKHLRILDPLDWWYWDFECLILFCTYAEHSGVVTNALFWLVLLGAEYVKKIEVYFCDLCRLYLPRLDQPERALAIHCRTRTHLQRYVRYRDDRALRNKAEKIHHRKEAAKENAVKEAEAKKSLEVKPEGEVEVNDIHSILKVYDPA